MIKERGMGEEEGRERKRECGEEARRKKKGEEERRRGWGAEGEKREQREGGGEAKRGARFLSHCYAVDSVAMTSPALHLISGVGRLARLANAATGNHKREQTNSRHKNRSLHYSQHDRKYRD